MRIIFLFLVTPLISFSQQKLDVEHFFSMGMAQFQDLEKPAAENVNFPWIEEYELRSETRDFELQKQEYTFRVSPSTPKKRKAQQSLYNHLRDAPDFEYHEAYCDLLFSIYEDWLSLFVTDQALILNGKMNQLLKDKQLIYEKMAGTGDFDLENLVKLQTEKSDISINQGELESNQNSILDKFQLENYILDFNDFATIETVMEVLISRENDVLTTEDSEIAYEKQLLIKELALENAERNQLFDFGQIRYQGPHSDDLEERVSIGLGMRIPNSGNRKLKMQELRLRHQQLERDEERSLKEKQNKLAELKQEILSDIQELNNYKSIMDDERSRLKKLGEQLSQKEGFSPILLLDIEERFIQSEIKELKKKELIFDNYLKYLNQSELICGASTKNYLVR